MSTITRRTLLQLAGAATLAAAASAAARAEGLPEGGAAPLFALTRPIHVGDVTLRVRDLDTMTGYYRVVLGLEVLSQSADAVALGAGGVPLLTLERHADAVIEPRRAAGLYHTAFLMPSRADLARWLVHVAMLRVPLTGFADHLVSEAVYLDDPEGNGIEVYSDRPESDWLWVAGRVGMGSEPLDIDGLLALTDPSTNTYAAAPAGLRVGHLHLRAGDIAAATAFYGTALGFEITSGRGDAVFLATGGYHHHLALNTWESAGAGLRDPSTTGLARFSLKAADGDLIAARRVSLEAAGHFVRAVDGGIAAIDPWGTELHLIG